MSLLPRAVELAIDAFGRLPGVGSKTAARLTLHLLQTRAVDRDRFVAALEGLRSGVAPCARCGFLSTSAQELCSICLDDSRVQTELCIVEGPLDVLAIDRSGAFKGAYHVLGGRLSPLDGIGPEQLRIRELDTRLRENNAITELIIATNPSLEGEATASFLQNRYTTDEFPSLSITRIARGLPMGSDVEYADPTTLARALEGRKRA